MLRSVSKELYGISTQRCAGSLFQLCCPHILYQMHDQGRISHIGKLGTCLGRQFNMDGSPHQKIEIWQTKTQLGYSIYINCVSCFKAGHIFVDIFMIMHCTEMKFGINVEAKHAIFTCKIKSYVD